jgi:hypothetical protein
MKREVKRTKGTLNERWNRQRRIVPLLNVARLVRRYEW